MKKELDMKARRRIGKVVAERYQRASNKVKSKILDESTKTAQYNRAYASWLLRNLWHKTAILPVIQENEVRLNLFIMKKINKLCPAPG